MRQTNNGRGFRYKKNAQFGANRRLMMVYYAETADHLEIQMFTYFRRSKFVACVDLDLRARFEMGAIKRDFEIL